MDNNAINTINTLPTRTPLSNLSNLHDTNWEHKDSSEGQPSSHDSICDAAWLSTSDLAKSLYQTAGRPMTPTPLPHRSQIDVDSESPLSQLETPFLYGYGTELAPILEQRSVATLRTKGSLSTSDLSSLMHDAPGRFHYNPHSTDINKNSNDDSNLRQIRRQHSFSLDDLSFSSAKPRPYSLQIPFPIPKRDSSTSPPKLKNTTALSRPRTVHQSEEASIVNGEEIHAYPQKPIYPPPMRARTPPGFARCRLPQDSTHTQNPNHSHSHKGHGGGEGYMIGTGAGASSGNADDLLVYEMPGFRQTRSGHGNLATHPFIRRPGLGTGPTRSTAPVPETATGPRPESPSSIFLPIGEEEGDRIERARRSTHAPVTIPRAIARITAMENAMERLAKRKAELRRHECKKCRHPLNESWSLRSTLVGGGSGVRRGNDWCGRCACRKIVRVWCCCGE